ncbi:hypothetical protein [Deinococcus cellulosilyticus]|uniref:N-acetyltransferase domain-containing protein n=1 Tax=Deinococcus cellulosilyticus (strain DSM 18568 / NBRC 106333 / KACC 11606 / 5516J-15) TaxID=1223518 RepID=A0A511MWS1_DEIC1|nr:hypothetical protein [Deinococcus cellulosilyticus]GEM45024.1 hypothetical protein DC3_06590 [Deinococcus cellulosilyticus NBRC 106333 = KACC 11606]
MPLPARVRVSKLKNCPSDSVLRVLKQLSERADDLRKIPEVAGSVASAGGQVIGFAVSQPAEAFVSTTWQKRGIEEELVRVISEASAQ